MLTSLTRSSQPPTRRTRATAISLLVALLLTAALLAGCGGGGGGGGGTPAGPTTANVHGTLINSATGTALAGYIVRYGPGTSLSATTNAQGVFSITVPPASLSITATLTILDASGNQVAIQPVNSSANDGNLGTVGVSLSGGPPGPPGGI